MQSDGTPWRPLAHVEDIAARVRRRARGAPRRRSTTRRSTSAATRTTTRSATSPAWSRRRPGAEVTLAPGAEPRQALLPRELRQVGAALHPAVERAEGHRADARRVHRPAADARAVPLPPLPAHRPPPRAGGGRRARRRAAPARARMSSRDTPLEQMPVVILAGGLGTRMREETERVPKPLVGIGERPILWHIMKLFGHHGAQRFVLCLGFKSWQIKEYFLRYREQIADLTVRLGDAGPPDVPHQRRGGLGGHARRDRTAHRHRRPPAPRAAVRRHRHLHPHLRRRPRQRRHRRARRLPPLARAHRHRHRRPPDLALRRDAGRRTTPSSDFDEKPTTAEGFVSGGFFVFQREFFDYLDDDPELTSSARRCATSPATASSPSSPTPASGWGWTPTASSPSSTGCGPRATRPGRSGTSRRAGRARRDCPRDRRPGSGCRPAP